MISSTTLGISFDVMDLDASYEVVGTSDNYSFQHKLGLGKNLVDSVGDSCDKIIPLYGNYGTFDVRVFAVSNIGIRSEFIQDTISISAPNFEGTFTFSNLRVNDLPQTANVGSSIIESPSTEGGKMIVESEFIERNIQLKWNLIPPVGHAQEGKSLDTELLNDSFFDHFEIKIYAGESSSLVSDLTLNESPALKSYLSSADPASALNYYRDFTLDIDDAIFEDLGLERINAFEVIAYDSFNRTCTGLITGINYEPYFNSFNYNIKSSTASFSWSVNDTDFVTANVSGIALPKDKTLYSSNSIEDNVSYYNKLNSASAWRNIPNKTYQADQFVLHTDGFVYKSLSNHTTSSSRSPANSSYWQKLEEPVGDFLYIESFGAGLNNFSIDQEFGMSYYYGIQPFDAFGEGSNYNVTEEGVAVGGDLKDFTSFVKISNLSFRERGDDLIFSWDIIDNEGNTVDLSQKKFILTESQVPKLLGFSGSLFDADTDMFIAPITSGSDSSSAAIDADGQKIILDGLHSTKIFNSYEYTREINNAIYKQGGFPDDLVDFDASTVYAPNTDPEYAISFDNEILEIKASNDIVTPYIRPKYELWESNKNYLNRSSAPYSDVVAYNGNVYYANQNSGPEYSSEFFNENNSYSAGDLVVLPNRSAEIFNSDNQYFVDSLVLYNGEVYKALKNQSEGNAVTPSMDSVYWDIAQESVDYFNAVYEAQNNITAPIDGSPILDTANWQLQSPGNSSSFSLVASQYDESATYSTNDLVFYEDIVYKALENNPSDSPIYAITESGGLNGINYTNSKWMPIWERSTNYDDMVFRHVGIPESGKRSVGLEIALLDNNENIIEKQRIVGINPEPSILSNGFNVDSFSEVTKTKFNFNYAFESQEKTTKVHLYRSDQSNFSILDSDGLATTGASTFVKQILGAADSTFGTNINSIVDDNPPIGDEITGYYYKLLPFDDFGSGDLYSVSDFVKIYPKNYSNPDPSVPVGPISENLKDNYVPGPVENFNGQTAFENFFLNWDAPQTTLGNSSLVPNDLEYYEVWASSEKYLNFPSLNKNLTAAENTGYNIIGQNLSSIGVIPYELLDPADGIGNAEMIFSIPASRPNGLEAIHKGFTNQKKYFWVRAVDHAGNKSPFVGDDDPLTTDVEGLELILGQAKTTDIANFEQNITEAFPNVVSLIPNNPFHDNSSTNGSISWDRHFIYYNGTGYVVGPGETSDPFVYWSATGKTPTHQESLSLLTQSQLTELGLTGEGGGPLNSSISNPLRNLVYSGKYDVSSYHPAGEGTSIGVDEQKPSLLGPDHDFIIAKNAAGIASPMWHSFANATIGSAHIQNAAITNAKIHNLTADKIRSEEIYGQDIQVGGDALSGQIRSAGFQGLVDPISNQDAGFAISGNGSFVFAGGGSSGGRLYFRDGALTLAGKLRTEQDQEYTFVDLDASPDSFFYNELSDGTYTPDGTQVCSIRAVFQNSTIEDDEVRFKVSSPDGYEFISYSDHTAGVYNVSGFSYNPSLNFTNGEPKVAVAQFNVNGFDSMINTASPQLTTIIVSASGVNTSTERSIPINFVADGASAVYVELSADHQVFEYNSDGNNRNPSSDPKLTATAYNTDGTIYYHFKDENGDTLQNTTNNEYDVVGIFPEKFSDMPSGVSVEISGHDDSNILASDHLTFFGTHPGKDSYTVFLTNENHTYPATEDGDVSNTDLSLGKTKVRFFRGTKEYTYDSSATPATDTFSITTPITKNPSSVGVTVDETSLPEIQLSAYSASANEGSLEITVEDNQYKTSNPNPATFEKIYTFSKAIEGVAARKVDLTAEQQAVTYDAAGSSIISPPATTNNGRIKLTATDKNTGTNLKFKFTKEGTFSGDLELLNQNSYTPGWNTGYEVYYRPPSSRGTSFNSDTIKVEISEDNGTNVLASDVLTIYAIQDGSDAITVILSNEVHSLSRDSNGVVDYSGSGTTISVFHGATALTYADPVASAGDYKITAVGDKISANQDATTKNKFNDASGLTAGSSSAKIEFTIEGKNLKGESFSITKDQTFSVSDQGVKGNKGVGVVFRGLYDANEALYVGADASIDGGRGDVVYHSNQYWICIKDNGTSIADVQTPSNTSTYWDSFQAQFSSVATDILLANDAVITRSLIMGEGSTNQNNQWVGSGGVIKTVGKEYGNGVTGFFLGNELEGPNNVPNPKFDIGGSDSYIRFNGLENKIELRGSLIINENQKLDLTRHSTTGENAIFIGGGYENYIYDLGNEDYYSLASSIVAGGRNHITGRFSFIGNGYGNTLADSFSAIVGGYKNSMPDNNTGIGHQGGNFIGCGHENIVSGENLQTILNGFRNNVSYDENFIVHDPDNGWFSPRMLGLPYQDPPQIGSNRFISDIWFPSSGELTNWPTDTMYSKDLDGIMDGGWAYSVGLSSWVYFAAHVTSQGGSLYSNPQNFEDSIQDNFTVFDPNYEPVGRWLEFYRAEARTSYSYFNSPPAGCVNGEGIVVYDYSVPGFIGLVADNAGQVYYSEKIEPANHPLSDWELFS